METQEKQSTLFVVMAIIGGLWNLDPHGSRRVTQFPCGSVDGVGTCLNPGAPDGYFKFKVNQMSGTVYVEEPLEMSPTGSFLSNCKIYDTENWKCEEHIGTINDYFYMQGGIFRRDLSAPGTPDNHYASVGYKTSKLLQWHLLSLPQAIALDRFLSRL